MNSGDIDIHFRDGLTGHVPGGLLEGRVDWVLNGAPPEKIDIRLFWFTNNSKDLHDVAVVESVTVPHPTASGSHTFSFFLPEGPWSLRGQLFTLHWAVEVLAGRQSNRAEFVMAPGGETIILPTLEDPGKSRMARMFEKIGQPSPSE